MLTFILLLVIQGECYWWKHVEAPEGDILYWITFKDKGVMTKPEEEMILSRRTQSQHDRFGPQITDWETPLSPVYLDNISGYSLEIITQSTLINSVSVKMAASLIPEIASLPFVQSVVPVGVRRELSGECPRSIEAAYVPQSDLFRSLGVDKLHKKGLKGKGIKVGIIDGSFFGGWEPGCNVNRIPSKSIINPKLKSLLPKHQECQLHGDLLFSIMAFNCSEDVRFSGIAPEASYWLYATELIFPPEDYKQEEHYFVEAIHEAIRSELDILSVSIGWDGFYPQVKHHYNGTTLSAMAVDKAFSCGILTFTAVGNGEWSSTTIYAPNDSFFGISVGSVDLDRKRSRFSVAYETADGRKKPDIYTFGQSIPVVFRGFMGGLTGTSSATPILAAVAACLKGDRQYTYKQLHEALKLNFGQKELSVLQPIKVLAWLRKGIFGPDYNPAEIKAQAVKTFQMRVDGEKEKDLEISKLGDKVKKLEEKIEYLKSADRGNKVDPHPDL